MAKRTYRQLVADGKRAVKKEAEASFAGAEAKWEQGDAALEVAPIQEHGTNQHSGGYARTLHDYAKDIGQSFETLDQYRKVAAAYPKSKRNLKVSWTLHRELMGNPRRFDLVHKYSTSREARAAQGIRPPGIGTSVREKVAAVRVAIESADVLQAVLKDEATADRVATALDKLAHRAVRVREEDTVASALNLVTDLRRMHQIIDRIAAAVTDGKAVVSQDMADAVVDEVVWLRNALDLIESGIRAGSLDEALAELIEDSK